MSKSLLTDVESFLGEALTFLEQNGQTAPATAAAVADATTTVTALKTAVEAAAEPAADKVIAYAASLVPGGNLLGPTGQLVANLLISKLTGLPVQAPSA